MRDDDGVVVVKVRAADLLKMVPVDLLLTKSLTGLLSQLASLAIACYKHSKKSSLNKIFKTGFNHQKKAE